MSDTKIKTSNISNLAVTHALLHTDMDLTGKTVQVAAPSSNTHPATKLYVDTEVANLIDSAPGTLDTLNELAAAVNDDANFNATIASSIATKLPLAGGTMTGNLQIYKAEPIITLQRSNNATLPGLSWQGSGGAEAASIKLDGTSGATNTLIMSTYNGSTMAERLRLMTNAAGGIAVTGTISVTGTVDGVDIAARDAILTSTTTTANAALPKAGGTMTGDLSFGDNDKAIFGTSQNLEIYANGGYSYIDEVGANNLNIRTNGADIGIYDTANSQYMARFATGGNARLFYNGSEKFATTSTGINVTGTVTADGLTVGDNSTNEIPIYFNSSSTDFSIGANGNNFILAQTTGDLDSNQLLTVTSTGRVGIGTSSPSVELSIAGADPQLVLWEGTDGASSSKVQLGTGTVQGFINVHKGNGTRTVQINSDGDSYFNGGNVGIGMTSPSEPLSVYSVGATGGDNTRVLAIYNNGTSYAGDAFTAFNAATGYDVNDKASVTWHARGTTAQTLETHVSASTTEGVHQNRYAALTNSMSDTTALHLESYYQYDGSGTTASDMVIPSTSTQVLKRIQSYSSGIGFDFRGDGAFYPIASTQDLGTSADPWRNIYTQDMHLSNESRETGNEIDGTKGNWTIQEGAEDLYIINNKSGKRFRFKLEELD